MTPYYEHGGITIWLGDCRDVLPGLEKVDAIVTDPPYGLSFMGKGWDRGVPGVEFWELAIERCKPGAHLLAFGGTRTYHRLACAIEDAGFEVRDSIHWVFGSGFPKGSRVSRDPRFCQCGGAGHSDANRAPVRTQDGRMGTVRPSSGDGPLFSSAPHSTDTDPDSLGDCLPGRDSCDEHAPVALADDPKHLLLSGHAPVHNHSDGHADGLDCESLHNPSLVQCNDRPSSLDCLDPADCENDEYANRPLNRSPDYISLSGFHTQDIYQDSSCNTSKPKYNMGFPCCQECGKPKADGYNVALKPAHEIICLARKPFKGTVADNVLKHGTGAINVDGCRVKYSTGETPESVNKSSGISGGIFGSGKPTKTETKGRWPPNVAFTHHESCGESCSDSCPVKELGEQSGELSTGKPTKGSRPTTESVYGEWKNRSVVGGGDTGTAARFFPCFKYNAKASRVERNLGLDTREPEKVNDGRQTPIDNPYQRGETPRRNTHSTVKPVDLMRWLVRLVTPPGGVVLDPFLGSGTTAMACVLEGVRCIGVEKDPEYIEIAKARIEYIQKHVERYGRPPIDMGTVEAIKEKEDDDLAQELLPL